MAYTPTVWATGDVITAEKLNHAEGGIEAAYPLIVTATLGDESATLDKTWAEIYAAHGNVVIIADDGETTQQIFNLYCVSEDGFTGYLVRVMAVGDGGTITAFNFESATEDGVLTATLG